MSQGKKHGLIPIISNEYGFKKLRIKAKDNEDLEILSSLCQDGIFSVDEMTYIKNNFRFIATFSRFCWEFEDSKYFDKKVNFRIVSGLQINNALGVDYINFSEKKTFLNLLSISFKKKFLTLNFSLDMFIKIKISDLNILLDDIDLPWPTYKKPIHSKI